MKCHLVKDVPRLSNPHLKNDDHDDQDHDERKRLLLTTLLCQHYPPQSSMLTIPRHYPQLTLPFCFITSIMTANAEMEASRLATGLRLYA